jgi:hypothetical protein
MVSGGIRSGRRPGAAAARAAVRWLPLAAATLLLGGCFQMVNVDPATLSPHDEVRIHLAADAAERSAREFGTVGPHLIGRIQPAGPDSLRIDTWMGQFYTDASLAGARLVVPVHRSEVLEVERRQVSVRRSILAGAAAAAMTALIIHRAGWLEPELGDDDEPGAPPPLEGLAPARAPGFTIRIPILRFGR